MSITIVVFWTLEKTISALYHTIQYTLGAVAEMIINVAWFILLRVFMIVEVAIVGDYFFHRSLKKEYSQSKGLEDKLHRERKLSRDLENKLLEERRLKKGLEDNLLKERSIVRSLENKLFKIQKECEELVVIPTPRESLGKSQFTRKRIRPYTGSDLKFIN